MTIKIAKKNFLDIILLILGKQREIAAIDHPYEVYDKYGPYPYLILSREGFWKTLLKNRQKK